MALSGLITGPLGIGLWGQHICVYNKRTVPREPQWPMLLRALISPDDQPILFIHCLASLAFFVSLVGSMPLGCAGSLSLRKVA